MKTDTRIKLKAALGIGVTYILFFAISINGHKVWGAILVIPYLYGVQYLYYKLIKRYTSWWAVWKEKTGNG